MLWLLLVGCGARWSVIDGDGDGVSVLDGDCDDADPSVLLGANQLWFPDEDTDGFGDPSSPAMGCSAPAGYVSNASDCDDERLDIYPGAVELCDGLDNDCSGVVDDEPADPRIFFPDSDGDGFGDEGAAIARCEAPEGYLSDGSDCDDGDATVFPGSTATEVPLDGIDTDCDGVDFCTDLSCDGRPDLVLGNQTDGTSQEQDIAIFLGASASLLSTEPISLAAEYISDVLVADLNADGYPDIATANANPVIGVSLGSLVWWGGPAGFESSKRTALPTPGAQQVIARDLNGDELPELIYASWQVLGDEPLRYSTNSTIFWGSTEGYDSEDRIELATLGAVALLAEDLDSDGALDVVFCNHRDDDLLDPYRIRSFIYWGGDFTQRTELEVDGCSDVAAADLDGNGDLELIFASYRGLDSSSSSSLIYWGDGGRFDEAEATALPTAAVQSVQAADLDGDGDLELVFGSQYDDVTGFAWSSAIRIFWGQDGGEYGATWMSDLDAAAAIEPHIADLDNNGYADLVAPGFATEDSYMPDSYIYWGSSEGLSAQDRTVLSTGNAVRATSGDLNGDGHLELVMASHVDGCLDTDCIFLDFETISRVYTGSASGPSDDDVLLLSTTGVWAAPVIVGGR